MDILEKTCKKMGLQYKKGPVSESLYSGRNVKGDFSFNLPGWTYPVVVQDGGETLKFDNYGGSWGNNSELDKLKQEYAACLCEDEVCEMGFEITDRVMLDDGTIELTCTEY
jgi:hypothetical protein